MSSPQGGGIGRGPRALLLLLFFFIHCFPSAAQAEEGSESGYEGVPLAEALHILQAGGLKIIFSTEVVRPDMRVSAEPLATWPREILDELLAPHGLQAQPGPRGTILVVKASPFGKVLGRVNDEETSLPIPDVRIVVAGANLESHSDKSGEFEIPSLPVGTYTLKAVIPGYFPGSLDEVSVQGGRTTRVRFDLTELPSELIIVTPDDPSAQEKWPESDAYLSRRDLLYTSEIGDDPLRTASHLPGVAGNDVSAQMNVKGGLSDELMIILDGLEIYEPFHLQDRQGFLSAIDPRIVGGLHYFGGAFPAEYGGRMSGVMELNSVTAHDELRTGVSLSSEHAGLINEGSFRQRKGRWFLSSRRGDPSRLLDALGADPSYDPRYLDAFGIARIDLSPATRLSFHFLTAYDDVEGRDGAFDSIGEEPGAFTSRYNNDYVWVRLQTATMPRLFSETLLSVGRLAQSRYGFSPTMTEVEDERTTYMLGLKQEFAFERQRNLLRWGLDVKHLSADYRYISTSMNSGLNALNENPGATESVSVNQQPSGQELGLYVADTIQILPSLSVDLGVRWDKETYTDFGDDTVSPRVNVAYSLGPRSTLRAGGGFFHQPQKIYELQVEDGAEQFSRVQGSEHLMLGFDHRFRNDLAFSVNAYRRYMTSLSPHYENLFNPLSFFPEADPDRIRVDPDKALARGLELFLRKPKGEKLNWWAGYTLASVEDEIGGEWIPRSWDQRHALDIGLTYRLGENWSFTAAGSYHSGRPTTPVTAKAQELPDGSLDIVPVLGPRNSDRFPSYHRVDLRIDRIIPVGQMDFRLFLNVINLYDRKNVCCVESFNFNLRPDGRVSVERQDIYGIPRLISLGVDWTF